MPVKRDPDTGKFVSVDDGGIGGLEYSDLRWHNQRIHLNAGSSSNTKTLDDHRGLDTENAPPDGLGHNEVAELVYLRVNAWTGVLNDGSIDTEPGMAEARLGFGFNLQEDEFSTKTPDNDVTNSAEDSSTTQSGAVSIGGPTDDPGLLWDQYMTVAWPGLDTTNGAGAGAGPAAEHIAEVISFPDLGMRGPVVDKTDELTTSLYIDKRQLSNPVRTGFQFQLGYLIHEIEDARSSFGMPGD